MLHSRNRLSTYICGKITLRLVDNDIGIVGRLVHGSAIYVRCYRGWRSNSTACRVQTSTKGGGTQVLISVGFTFLAFTLSFALSFA